MSVVLTNEQYGALFRGLSFIAGGCRINANGNMQRIPRDKLVEVARELCEILRVHYIGDGSGFRGYDVEDAS